MAFIGLLGAVTITVVSTLWAFVKVLRWRLEADTDDRQQATEWALEQVSQMQSVALLVLLLAEFGWGIAAWATSVWEMIL